MISMEMDILAGKQHRQVVGYSKASSWWLSLVFKDTVPSEANCINRGQEVG